MYRKILVAYDGSECSKRALLAGIGLAKATGAALVSLSVRQGGFDLLVAGFTGHSKVFGRIMGGTAENLVRLASCPVLVIK